VAHSSAFRLRSAALAPGSLPASALVKAVLSRPTLDEQAILPHRWMIAIAVMSSAVMQLLDTTVVNVSLPHIAGSLSSTTEEATWVLTSYLVANAIILPVTGWLAGVLGRKRLLLICVTGFTVSSLLCGLSLNLPMLIVFRVIQGVTGGGLQPLSQAVLLEEFPGKEQGKAMAFWSLGIIAAPIFGPTLGGFITDTWTWRWVFFINLPVGVLSLLLISEYVYDPHYLRRRTLGVDAWGIGMLVVGMGALQIMLDKGQEKDWFGSSLICWLAVLAVAGLASFVVRELRAKDPIVHFGMLRSRTFSSGVVLVTIMGFVLTGSLVLLPLFMQTLLGWTATIAGIWNSPRGVGTAICMPLVAYLLGKGWDARRLLIFGFATAGICFFYYARMTLDSGTWDIFWIQIVQGFGLGFLFVPLATLTMSPVPKAETAYATSLFNTVRNIGASMGISFVTTMLARRSQFHQQILGNHITPSSALGQQALAQLAALMAHQGIDRVTATQKAAGLIYRLMQQQAALLSYADAFYLMGILFLLNIPVVLLMRAQEHDAKQPRERSTSE
jgi:MFS transporter, DHA2 family, multidrug resistance protein